MTTESQYEVRCPSCDVTFPIGTKKCMHCGGRTGPSHIRVAERALPYSPIGGGEAVGDAGSPPTHDLEPLSQGSLHDDESAPRRGLLRSAGTLIWVLMLVGFSLMRACTDE
jgi:hypothetical protein